MAGTSGNAIVSIILNLFQASQCALAKRVWNATQANLQGAANGIVQHRVEFTFDHLSDDVKPRSTIIR